MGIAVFVLRLLALPVLGYVPSVTESTCNVLGLGVLACGKNAAMQIAQPVLLLLARVSLTYFICCP